jgi:hypothetical protein
MTNGRAAGPIGGKNAYNCANAMGTWARDESGIPDD